MKNKIMIMVGLVIGLMLIPIDNISAAYSCSLTSSKDSGDTCTKINYKYDKDGNVKGTSFTIGIYTWETDSSQHEIIVTACSGKTCNDKRIAMAGNEAITSNQKTPVAICGHPGNYDSDYQYGITADNYKKFIYFSQEEVNNSTCSEDDIYYNVDSYPGKGTSSNNSSSGNNNTGNTNTCLEGAGITCVYKKGEQTIQYGYTQKDGKYQKFVIVNGKYKKTIGEAENMCTCPDYVVYDKEQQGYKAIDTTDLQNYTSSRYQIYNFTDSQNLDESDVNENGLPTGIANSTNTTTASGTLYCNIFGENTWKYVKSLYKIIKICIPFLIIILGMLDFMKVLLSGEQKDMKLAGQRFMKRIIAGVVLLLIPVLLKFLFNVIGFSENCLQQLFRISLK